MQLPQETTLQKISALPLFWLLLAFLIGIVIGQLWPMPTMLWFGLSLAGLVVGFLAWLFSTSRPSIIFSLIPMMLFLGGLRYQAALPIESADSLSNYNETDARIWVTGTIIKSPDVRDHFTYLTVAVDKVDFADGNGDLPIQGTLLLRVSAADQLKYGDYVRARGFLRTPPEDEEFSYRSYLARKGILSYMQVPRVTYLPLLGESKADPFWENLYQYKLRLFNRIYRLYPDPEASLLAGVLLGLDEGLSPSLQEAFKNTGTSHIIAISGFNIAIIAALFVSIFSRIVGKRWGAFLALVGIVLYTLLVGAEPSVVRAAIMGGLSIIARQLGRRNFALNTLAFSAVVMAAYDPFVLQDVGFQLSFGATLGLVLYAQPVQDATHGFLLRFLPDYVVEKIIGPISDYVLLTFAAQITTLPIIIYHFGRISLVSFIANPFILPAQPPVMILGGLSLFAYRLYEPLGQFVAIIAWPFPAYTIRMVEFFNEIPFGSVDFNLGQMAGVIVTLFYILLLGLTLGGAPFRRVAAPFVTSGGLAIFIAVAGLLTWRSYENLPDGRLHVTFLNVGTADAVLIRTPNGRSILINGGSSPSLLSDQLGRRLPPFERELDYLVIASTQSNQLKALPTILHRFPPKSALWAGSRDASYEAAELNKWLTDHAVRIKFSEVGDELDLGEGARLRILDVSTRGSVLLVEWKTFRAVLPIGVNYQTFENLENGQRLGPVTAVLLSEAGYARSNPPQWLLNLSPQFYILSVAADDQNGLPEPALVILLQEKNLLRTDVNGWIDLATDGSQLWLEAEKK